jgi:hypothetical protein
MLEFIIFKRRRNFCWQVRYQNGKMVATGRQKTRPAARYHAYRALFLVLVTGWKENDPQPHRPGSPRIEPHRLKASRP